MSFRKLIRCIETLPRAPYIFLKALLMLSDAMLSGSALLFLSGDPAARRLAVCFLETPAGVLLLGLLGLAFLLDRTL